MFTLNIGHTTAKLQAALDLKGAKASSGRMKRYGMLLFINRQVMCVHFAQIENTSIPGLTTFNGESALDSLQRGN